MANKKIKQKNTKFQLATKKTATFLVFAQSVKTVTYINIVSKAKQEWSFYKKDSYNKNLLEGPIFSTLPKAFTRF